MNHQFRLIIISVTGLLLGGCFFSRNTADCRSVQEYQESVAVNPVVVPPTLSAPDQSSKLVIPKEPLPTRPLAETAACLARPPDYFRKATSADVEEKGATVPASTPLPEPKSPAGAAPPAPSH